MGTKLDNAALQRSRKKHAEVQNQLQQQFLIHLLYVYNGSQTV